MRQLVNKAEHNNPNTNFNVRLISLLPYNNVTNAHVNVPDSNNELTPHEHTGTTVK